MSNFKWSRPTTDVSATPAQPEVAQRDQGSVLLNANRSQARAGWLGGGWLGGGWLGGGWPRAWKVVAGLFALGLLLSEGAAVAQAPPLPDRPPPLSQKEDRPKVEIAQKAGEPKEISFDDLVFEMEKGGQFKRTMLTEKINQMDGSQIRIRGFIRPAFKETGISKFVFVRDNQECCFGPGAALYDCILVELAGDKTTDYTVRPITVLGTLYLKEFKGPDGNIWAIYRMKNASVQ